MARIEPIVLKAVALLKIPSTAVLSSWGKSGFFFLRCVQPIITALVFCGCSAGYMPVDKSDPHASYNGTTSKKIALHRCELRVWLGVDEKEADKFLVYLSVEGVVKDSHPTLANLKIELKEPSERSGTFVLQTVHERQGLFRIKDGKYRSIFDSVWNNFKPMDVTRSDEGVTYLNVISYEFRGNTATRHRRKMQVNIEASVKEKGEIETVKDSVLFKRFHAIMFH